jgi:RNA-splicing ligase RtcB
VVSPGGVGYDINCGVRLLRTNLKRPDVERRIEDLVNLLFRNIPSGVGSRRKDLKLRDATLFEVMRQGAGWAVKNGYGSQADLEHIEAHGKIDEAEPERVSQFAMDRGHDQGGTLGAGNPFVEVGDGLEIFAEPGVVFGLVLLALGGPVAQVLEQFELDAHVRAFREHALPLREQQRVQVLRCVKYLVIQKRISSLSRSSTAFCHASRSSRPVSQRQSFIFALHRSH